MESDCTSKCNLTTINQGSQPTSQNKYATTIDTALTSNLSNLMSQDQPTSKSGLSEEAATQALSTQEECATKDIAIESATGFSELTVAESKVCIQNLSLNSMPSLIAMQAVDRCAFLQAPSRVTRSDLHTRACRGRTDQLLHEYLRSCSSVQSRLP